VFRWYLVLTKPRGEAKAKTHLERQGYGVLLPRLRESVLSRGRWVERVVPLFPRYLFSRLNISNQSLAPMRSSVGVSEVVRFGTDYAVVPDAIVDNLINRADPESGLHILRRRRTLEPGMSVQVIAGAFDGLDGIFEREDGDERVLVFLKFLGREVSVRVPSAYVVPDRAA
jgi:transcriptional antiterminator RfaH